jgi:hypothetical protein
LQENNEANVVIKLNSQLPHIPHVLISEVKLEGNYIVSVELLSVGCFGVRISRRQIRLSILLALCVPHSGEGLVAGDHPVQISEWLSEVAFNI